MAVDLTVVLREETTTTLHFSWTEEQVEALLLREVNEYMHNHVPALQIAKAVIDVRFGARYEGGIEASATVTIKETLR